MKPGLLLVLLSAAQALCAQTFQHSYGIVIGVGTYQFNKDLPNAKADAEAIAAFLKSQNYKVTQLYNQDAKRAAILDAIDNVALVADEHDRVVFFFAGHGYTETRGDRDWGYIVPYDGRPGTTSSMIGMEELHTQSERMGKARHQLFLMDSCYGGSIGTRDSPSGVDPKTPNYLEEITRRPAREALTAGGRDQQVEDGAANGHSRFTSALLEALQDGKADLNSDGYITFSELSAYTLPRATSRQQTPAQAILPGHGLGEYWFVSPRGPSLAARPAEPAGVRRGVGGMAQETSAPANAVNVPANKGPEVNSPAVELHGPAGFEPISIEKGYKEKPVLAIGTSILEARLGSSASEISISYKGVQLGSLRCEDLSIESSPAAVVDLTGATIPNVDHVTLKSAGLFSRNSSFSYYSARLSAERKQLMLQEFSGICGK